MDVISLYDKEFRNDDHLMMSVYDKKKLKLDLTSKVKKQDNSNAILTSPDLKLLKLDSPELERIILATAGSATPTPKQYRRGKGTSDLSVKEQQEHYVRGFEDALNKMRQQAALTSSSGNESVVINNNNTSTFGTVVVSNNNNNNVNLKPIHEHEINVDLYAVNTTMAPSLASNPHFQTIPTINYGSTTTQPDIASYEQPFRNDTNRNATTAAISIEPTKTDIVSGATVVPHVPTSTDDITAAELLVEPMRPTALVAPNDMRTSEQSVYSSQAQSQTTSNTPLSTVPIDLHKQELVKSERKKHRNRVAASKCRKRKLERESNLQDTVDQLKTRNVELGEIAATLRQQVCELKLQVMDHVKSGCEVLLAQPLRT